MVIKNHSSINIRIRSTSSWHNDNSLNFLLHNLTRLRIFLPFSRIQGMVLANCFSFDRYLKFRLIKFNVAINLTPTCKKVFLFALFFIRNYRRCNSFSAFPFPIVTFLSLNYCLCNLPR